MLSFLKYMKYLNDTNQYYSVSVRVLIFTLIWCFALICG